MYRFQATRRGLSLIELLVVLAVISLMVGIAAPATKHLRQQADMLECQLQLRTLAVSLATYAVNAGGSLPPGPIEVQGPGSPWRNDPDRGSPLVLFDAARVGRTDLSSQKGWYGQGLLWEGGYVEDGRLYYCPEVRRMGWGYDQAWPQRMNSDRTSADGKTLVWTSYVYRGGLTSQAGTPNGPLNVYRNPSTSAVLADSPCFNSMWHEDGYNIAFIDGRVRFFHFDSPIVPDGRLQYFWQSVDASGQ